MQITKNYVVDTNVLLEDPNALFKLRNGNENLVYIPFHVLLELNKFKKDPRLGHIANLAIRHIAEFPDQFKLLKTERIADSFSNQVDNHILEEIRNSGLPEPILVTNDRVFQLQAGIHGIRSETYKESVPSKSEAERYTGFVTEAAEILPNCFMWSDTGKPVFLGSTGEKVIDYQHKTWNVSPRNVYQNLALELMNNPDIPIVTIQSAAGYGKSFLALAAALYQVLEKKRHEKIYVVKPMIEIGQKLGYLPGRIDEKMEPYTRYMTDLMLKLHQLRPANRIFVTPDEIPPVYNPKRFELLPLAYIRGMNIENAVVIIDEMQNMSRSECRSLLSRMGEGVKCICLGDIHQVDNPYLNIDNNGMNWVVNKFKGSKIYAHLVLKGEKSRGPITDLVIRSGL
jgi:PhoH-like ATPase